MGFYPAVCIVKSLVLSVIALAISLSASAQEEQVRVGVLAPLSGDVAPWGNDTKRALELANERIGEGRIKLIFEDDRCVGKDAVTAARKLLAIDRVHFGMTVCTEPTLSVAPIFNQEKRVIVAPGATAAAVTGLGDYIFRTWPSDQVLVEMVFNHLARRVNSVAVLTEARGFPQEFSKAFVALAERKGVAVAAEDFATGETDFRSLILRVKAKGMAALLVSTDSDRTLANVLQQVREQKWQLPMYGSYVVGTASFLSKHSDLAEGIVFGDSPAVACSETQQDCDIYREFEKRYSIQSANYMVASSISAFRVIRDMVLSGQDPRAFLYSARFESAIGSFHFDSNGDVVGPTPSLMVIRNGKAEIIHEEAPRE